MNGRGFNLNIMKLYFPLLIVEVYLFFTLVLFYFGPVKFKIHNELLFLFLILIYHGFFVGGYTLAAKLTAVRKITISRKEYSELAYWLLFLFGMVGVWSAYRNIMMIDTVIPYDFFNNLLRGFAEPGLAYTERMMNLDNVQGSGSRIFNITSIFFAFAKLLFVFYFLFHWAGLGVIQKLIALIYSFLFIATGISAGINSIVFIFFIFGSISLLVVLYERGYIHFRKVLFISGLLFLVPLTWFGKIMSERGGGFEYFASTSPRGDITVTNGFYLNDAPSFFDFLYYSFVWLCYYVCQGYYGFSLILDLDFKWTYGFGNSEFLQRQLLMISGVDVSPLTFQARIDNIWDKSAQWHSFYGQFANDVSVIGLAFLMFGIGFIFSKVWKSVLYEKNFYGLALIPIFTIMFIFLPANNQVFGFIDTLSYFIIVFFLWLFNSTRIRF
jgi:hypothetical protein